MPCISLAGKRVAVLGVADSQSLAWAIALELHRSGAQVIVGYQQKFFSRIRLLLEEYPAIQGQRCDVLIPDEVNSFFSDFCKPSQRLDGIVHSVAFGAPSLFTHPPSWVNSLDFGEALEVSAHSLAKVVHYARPYLNSWASVVTLTFQASQRAMPLYGTMGVAKAALESLVRYLALELGSQRIRVNAISAGPVETLAALSEIIALMRDPGALKTFRGLDSFKSLLNSSAENELETAQKIWKSLQNEFAEKSAIPEKVHAQDIGETAAFLLSDASRKITGQVLNVDCGLSACQIL